MGDRNDGINVFETALVGRERIVIYPGLFTIDVRLRAISNTQEHDLREGETPGFGPFEDRPGVRQSVVPKQSPLSRTQREGRLAFLIDKIPAIPADLDGMDWFSSVYERGQ